MLCVIWRFTKLILIQPEREGVKKCCTKWGEAVYFENQLLLLLLSLSGLEQPFNLPHQEGRHDIVNIILDKFIVVLFFVIFIFFGVSSFYCCFLSQFSGYYILQSLK